MKLNKKIILIASVLLAIIAVVLLITLSPKSKVVLTLVPDTAELKIDNNKVESVKNGQVITLSPGVYLFQFSRDGFASQTSRVTIKKGETTPLTIALIPQTDSAKKLIANNPAGAAIIKQALDEKNTALLDRLPLTTPSFSITRCKSVKNLSDTADKAVCITLPQASVSDAALLYAKNAGYTQDDFEILIGSQDKKTVLSSDSYRIEYYSNFKSSKMPLFITPTNSATDQSTLIAIKDRALSDLTARGYDISRYDIYYSNPFLSRFNPQSNDHDMDAVAPI